MLTGTNLNKTYKSGKALDNVSVQIEPGKIYGLLGRNGAGKTTLFKILCGLISPDSGNVTFTSAKAKPIGGIIESPGLYGFLNAYDNLKVFAGIQNLAIDKASLEAYLLKVGLPTDRKDPVRNFSMGMKQRLAIAIALLNNPDYLVLDEPFSGLDPIGVASLIKLIQELAADNIGILLSSHLMGELTKSCHYLFVIENGQIINSGTTSRLIEKHIDTYTITGNSIENSAVLKQYGSTFTNGIATVKCNAGQVPQLLNSLHNEGTLITSCTPELTLEQLLTPQTT